VQSETKFFVQIKEEMSVEIISKKDLVEFRIQLLNDIKEIIRQEKLIANSSGPKCGYKTKQVKAMLQCCTNTLNNLRVDRKLRTKKIGGSLYYNPDDIKKILEEDFQS
jgi:helix-turn-helix protein